MGFHKTTMQREQQHRQESLLHDVRCHDRAAKLQRSPSSDASTILSFVSSNKERLMRRHSITSPIEWFHVKNRNNNNNSNNSNNHHNKDGMDSENLSIQDDDASHLDVDSTSWQEEAHWMSFRHAVQQVVASRPVTTQTPHHNHHAIHQEKQSHTHADLKHGDDDDEDDDSGVLVAGVPRHVVMLTTLSSPTDYTLTSNHNHTYSVGHHNLDDSNSSLASDLAETKMRLALAQAERDEFEYALLFLQQPKLH